jgi:glycine hydroxymethyltransferase
MMHVIAAKAVAFKEAMEPSFKEYQQQVLNNSRAMAAEFLSRNVNIVSGGTDNHLFLVDLRDKGLTGKELDSKLEEVHITVNKNAVPNDPQSPFVTSGIRIGTPSITTRGFKEEESRLVANLICDLIENMGDESVKNNIRAKVDKLCSSFPVYGK